MFPVSHGHEIKAESRPFSKKEVLKEHKSDLVIDTYYFVFQEA